MLRHLHIQDFTIIKNLSLDIHDGMSAITGETGAGKSIMFDALSYCLGARADSKAIRPGATHCDMTASFDIETNTEAVEWLTQRELYIDNDCLLRRRIHQDGRSKSFINGQPMPLHTLKELGTLLVSIHGQHEHQALFKREHHRRLLDSFAGHISLCDKVKQAYESWRKLFDEQQILLSNNSQDAEKALLRYQVDELRTLDLTQSALETMEQEHSQLANSETLLSTSQHVLHLLDNLGTGEALTQLSHIEKTDPSLKNVTELISSAQIHLDEAHAELNAYLEGFDCDPERLQTLDAALTKINDIARKHNVKARELPVLLNQLESQLATLDSREERLRELDKLICERKKDYQTLAQQLTKSRKKTSQTLSKQVTDYMQTLGMNGGALNIVFHTLDQTDPHPNGHEIIEFTVRTNPGQNMHPLHKVASGGEISRIALAIQVITAEKVATPCLLFDEVDVGIGGATAHRVGELLRKLGEATQVICVTHLAQVAGLAHHHLKVEKWQEAGTTQTRVLTLEKDARVQEIARMIGGAKVTDQILASARELLA